MMLTTDLFLVTHLDDYDWVKYLIRSINLFVSGYRRLVVVLEEQDPMPEAIAELCCIGGVEVRRCRNYRGTDVQGITGQQIEKYRAWHYSNAERIVFIDSDSVFCRTVDLQIDPSINLEKPVIIARCWGSAGPATRWYENTRDILGFEPPGETMCRHPFVFPRGMLEDLWYHVGPENRLSRWLHPVEFNAMGNYALAKCPEDFSPIWIDGHVPMDPITCAVDVGDPCIHQFWSHHRATNPAVQKVLGTLGLL